jgi:hypothetical protein
MPPFAAPVANPHDIGALGRIALDHDGDFATAARQLERALSLAPTDADIVYTAGGGIDQESSRSAENPR